MFNYLNGEITDLLPQGVVIDVNGIGYEVGVTTYTLNNCHAGLKCKLYVYMQVKEDGISLYGFSGKEEKNMFTLLISVSGVGCKVALAILSGMDFNALAAAIYNGDTSKLTKIKGLGKKTAERLVLELKEKVIVGATELDLPIMQQTEKVLTSDMKNAIAVLCSLGKSQGEAEKLVEAASGLGATTAEELINMAFRIN